MANIRDYLKWRGDVPMTGSGFNEVDGLILSMLSYIDFTNIISEDHGDGPKKLKVALSWFFDLHKDGPIERGTIISDEVMALARDVAGCSRFSGMGVSAYRAVVDPESIKQFHAVTFFPGDGTKFITFRGTGSGLVGWKENFNMSFMLPVPAQKEAGEYLTQSALAGSEAIRLGGHSKGGNLAIYAAAVAAPWIQDRILETTSYDGPGFPEGFNKTEGYIRIKGKIRALVPQSSVVGMLLEQSEDYEVVKSSRAGLWQHDGFSWEVLGTEFIHLDSITGSSKFLDKSLNQWVSRVSPEEREKFVDALFYIIDKAGIDDFSGINEAKLKRLNALVKYVKGLDKETREVLSKTVRLLFKEGKNTLFGMLPKMREKTALTDEAALDTGSKETKEDR